MRRKLVKQGLTTMMVSLPSKWIKRLSLKKGDEVDIEEADNKLVISKGEVSGKKTAQLDLTNYTESSIRTAVVNAYRAGYDLIEIHFQNEKQQQIVRSTLKNYLIGFEVTKQEKNQCVIENITEPAEEQFDIIFKKIIFNISLLIDGTEQRLRGKAGFGDYLDIVMNIHQYDNFCRRVMSKQNIMGSSANLFWSFLTLLVHAQRELYHLNRFLDTERVKVKNFEMIAHIRTLFGLLRDGYINKEPAKLEKIHELEKKIIYKDFYRLVQKGQKESIILYHLASCARNLYLASSPAIGLLLEKPEQAEE